MAEYTRILVVGPSGVGKSTIGNKLLGLQKKDPRYLQSGSSADSCTQKPATITSNDGKLLYTDVPGIPDPDRGKTVKFYDMIVQEAKRPCTAILYVFAATMRMGEAEQNLFKEAALMFNELNKSSATKILLLNDMFAWSNPEGLDKDDDDYKEGKATKDKERAKCHQKNIEEIKNLTGIDFAISIVCYGMSNLNEGNMNDTVKFLKEYLQSFPCQPSPDLQSFKDLSNLVDQLRKNKNYEEELVESSKKKIRALELTLTGLEVTFGLSAAGAAVATGLSFITFGATLGIATPAAIAAVANCSAIQVTKVALEHWRGKISSEGLRAAVRELEAQCKEFGKLEATLKQSRKN